MGGANPASEWGDLATLARGKHVRKSLVHAVLMQKDDK